MVRSLIAFALSVAALAAADSRAPVLVELFTSEGCSSCPPADKVLEQLDRHAIVLSEHVDYWDQLGWKDRFSSHAVTQRQQDYARQLSLKEVYTPQMIVDGAVSFNGSEKEQAQDEIAKAARHSKATVRIAHAADGLQVDITDAPQSANVYLVLADNSDDSQVSAGENQGHKLRHVAVVRSLRKIGSVKKGGAFTQSIAAPDPSQRVVVFVQQSDMGPISGAAEWSR